MEQNDKLIQFLETLSQKLGVKADHLYKVLLRQVKLDAIKTVIIFCCLLLVIPFLIHFWHILLPLCVPENPNGQYSFEREWPQEIQFSMIALGAASLVETILLIAQASATIDVIFANIMNPEAAVIEKILNSVK